MSFLLAKIIILLLLALLLGVWLGRWSVRRHYEDVTVEYSRLQNDWSGWRKAFDEKLSTQHSAVDLQPLHTKLSDLDRVVRAIELPKPVHTDLSPVLSALSTLRLPESKAVDLSEVHTRLQRLEQNLQNIRPCPAVDLTPVLQKLAALEARAPMSAAFVAPPAAAQAFVSAAHPVVRAGSSNLLKHAAYGAPDDLKLIKGVAEVLEKMLHDIGVYYFWQIADWTPQDVEHADAQLTVFKGRIERDHWIAQSKDYARQPNMARKPTQL
jgi:predicted flap endonuclease-1-like 5' DNA nuclease